MSHIYAHFCGNGLGGKIRQFARGCQAFAFAVFIIRAPIRSVTHGSIARRGVTAPGIISLAVQ